MSKALAKYKRESHKVSFTLTDRDVEILAALNRYRYLRTGQIKRLVFPGNTTLQSTRRRLKYLYHHHYVGRVVPFVRLGQDMPETAYYLDKAGTDFLAECGETVNAWPLAKQIKHQFLQHALDISEFRLQLEQAIDGNAVVSLHRFTADFEIKTHTEAAAGKHRYKLYAEHQHPVSRARYVVYPDALIVFRGKGEFEKYQTLFFLEIDRGTEGLQRIRDKVIGYNQYLRQKVYKKFGEFESFRVLFQTTSEKRALNMREALLDLEGTDLVWITQVGQVDEGSILHGPIWMDSGRNVRSILKPGR